jgi:hypothetical protein
MTSQSEVLREKVVDKPKFLQRTCRGLVGYFKPDTYGSNFPHKQPWHGGKNVGDHDVVQLPPFRIREDDLREAAE